MTEFVHIHISILTALKYQNLQICLVLQGAGVLDRWSAAAAAAAAVAAAAAAAAAAVAAATAPHVDSNI